MAEIKATERNISSRTIMLSDETLQLGREADEMLSIHRRAGNQPAADEHIIMQSKPQDEVSFLRLPELKSVTGLSKSSLYASIRAKSFPSPVQLGPRTVAWVRSEVRQWAAERISKSRSASPHIGERRTPQRAIGESWATPKKYA
jgi:prophage regulatory protein